jgi:hypothetical protein
MDRFSVRRAGALCYCAAVLGAMVWSLLEHPHRDVGEEAAQFKMVPAELQIVMANADDGANAHLNAVVELFGVVAENNDRQLVFEGGVIAAWDTTRQHRTPDVGELIRLKGRVTGYDDLFEEVRMDGAVLLEGAP